MAEATGDSLRLETFLPYRLNVAAALISEGLATVYADRFGIDIPCWRVLATLGQLDRATATGIGQHSRMHKTKVSRAVTALVARGYLLREDCPTDRRTAILSLTGEGAACYRAIVPLALAYEAELMGKLSSAAQAGLGLVLDELLLAASAT